MFLTLCVAGEHRAADIAVQKRAARASASAEGTSSDEGEDTGYGHGRTDDDDERNEGAWLNEEFLIPSRMFIFSDRD